MKTSSNCAAATATAAKDKEDVVSQSEAAKEEKAANNVEYAKGGVSVESLC